MGFFVMIEEREELHLFQEARRALRYVYKTYEVHSLFANQGSREKFAWPPHQFREDIFEFHELLL